MIFRNYTLLFLCALFLSMLSGCAFLNTLYLGWSAFNKAEKVERNMKKTGADSAEIYAKTEALYQRAIDKSVRVIDYYQKSQDVHDDAYFLKGKACLKKQDFSCAIFSFLTLQERFSASKRIADSWFLLAQAYNLNEDYSEASEALDYYIATYPTKAEEQEVLMLRADLAMRLKGKGEAISFLEQRLAVVTDPTRRLYILDRLSALYFDLQQYSRVVELLEQRPSFDRKQVELFFSVEYRLAQSYYRLGEYEKTAIHLQKMSENQRYFSHRDKLQLFSGKLFFSQKEYDNAEQLLTRLVVGKGRPEYRGEAYYVLANISIDIRNDLKKGELHLLEAVQLVVDPALKGEIQKRLDGLRNLTTLQESLAKNDPDSADLSLLRYKIGEVYWLDTRLPDSALVYFDYLLQDSTTADTLRASAMYAKAWILKAFKNDTLQAHALYERIIQQYPTKEVAKQSQIELGEKVTIMTRVDSAWVQFDVAENLRLKKPGYDKDVYYAYLLTALKYADINDVAARALYAAGTVVNERAHGADGTLDTATVKIFTRLCSEYPTSLQCAEVKFLLQDEAVQGFAKSYEDSRKKAPEEVPAEAVSLDKIDKPLLPKDAPLEPPKLPDFSSWI